jgi:radical SAM protein with 4Fe4S-binding SPASM domain
MIKGEDENRSNCILGTKTLFVTPEGKFYGCEKTGESFKIGSLTNGYNFEIIRRIESEWRKKTGRKCKTCFVQAFCSACVATAGFKGRIILGKYCNERKKDFLEKVSEYIEYQKKG